MTTLRFGKLEYDDDPIRVKPRQLESKIENAVCNYGRKLGWLMWKFKSPSQKGVPDRICIGNGKTIFIEFKATGETPTDLQERIHKMIRDRGVHVYAVDDINVGIKLLDELNNVNA